MLIELAYYLVGLFIGFMVGRKLDRTLEKFRLKCRHCGK